FQTHVAHQHPDLGNAALQTLGFCVFNSTIASCVSGSEVQELLSTLNGIAVKAADKNSCTRALWVISKQNFSPEEVGKAVPSILSTLENILNKDVQSLVIAYEALNVVIRLLEQAPAQMTAEAVRWAKFIIPLVIHSASKVRIRAATVLEIGVPLLLHKQQEVAALTEQLMTTKIIAELHKLFATKNETYVLKLWPLFVKILGKTLHRSGSFINSLLQLEELGFRSGTPTVKKIAFIAWKSLIDNFALNPDILCSSKRLKLLMQPLSSINVRTELLALTKVEVWWYLLLRLGPNLPAHFEQVCLPLIQSALSVETPATPLRGANQSLAASTPLQKGSFTFNSPATPKINLNSSLLASVAFPSVHLLGIEMMLHFLLGPEVVQFAARHKLVLSLEPLQHRLVSSASFFSKHASTLLGAVQDGFITIGKDASGTVLHAVWRDMIDFVKNAMDTGSKKEKQGSEVLTFLLQALKNIIVSDSLQVEKCLSLLECTVKGLPQKVLASAAYQVANMDLLNGTPALFLIQLHFHPGLLEHGVTEERFFMNYETLVAYVFSGPTSPLAFSESVLQELNHGAKLLENKELLWRMWSILINPLTERINQTNEVNQGDALEHNFSALHSALLLPIRHIFPVADIPQPTMKTLMRSWSELYKAFSRCAALVTTTDENVCCEELCSRILAGLGDQTLVLPLLERLVQVITVVMECFNFAPYSTKFQPKTKGPHTPTDWSKKKKGPLGNLDSVLKVLDKLLEGFHSLCSDRSLIEASGPSLTSIGSSVLSCLSACISHISLPSVLRTVFSSLTKPVSIFYAKTKSESPKVYGSLGSKLDKLLGDILSCLGSRYTGSYDNELLEILSPLLCALFLHKNKSFRNQVTQFWNGSFAKAAVLVYTEELKPVLSQVKRKTPIILPGFTYCDPVEESSGAYSDNLDSSELGTKISGIEVKSAGKRELLLTRTEELKGTPTKGPQAKLKLDFSSPNNKKKLLEEEQSVDFVFILPETKERVLTEHQKEVLRTKRVDIPTMYNNLDASQDTTLFTQYTQSQESSSEKPEILNGPKEAAPGAKMEENGEMEISEPNEERTSLNESDAEMLDDEAKAINDSSALNPSDDCPNATTDGPNTSNISNGSSDMVLGTPPPPPSRRQSFITLEKFDGPGNRSFSPLVDKKFVKSEEVILVPDSQEAVDTTERENPEQNENSIKTEETSSRRETRASRAADQAKDTTTALEDDDQKTGKESADISVSMEGSDIVPDSQPTQEKTEELETAKNVIVSNTDSKENTPPDTDDKAPPQKTLTKQISLRRSSRRQSEILDAVRDQNESEKRTPTQSEPKAASKKTGPAREAAKRPHRETEKSEGEDDPNISRKPQEDTEVTRKILSHGKKEEELPDSNSCKDSQEKVKSRGRYQTRRSLQGAAPAIDNSESENSETLEGSVKKRRRGRPRSTDKSKGEGSQESQVEVEGTVKPSEDVSSVVKEEKTLSVMDNKTYTLDFSTTNSETLKAESDGDAPAGLSTTEYNKTCDLSKDATEVGSAMESAMTEPMPADFSTLVSDVFQSSQSGFQSLNCSHKRSKRIRKSKNCDCCIDSTTKILRPDECESKNHKTIMSSTMQLNDTTFSGPCAISTPLAGEQGFFKTAGEIGSYTESEQEQTITPLSDSNHDTGEVTQVFVPAKTVEASMTPSEISINETVVAGSPKDAKLETVIVETKSLDNNGEDNDMEVGKVNEESARYKTYEKEATDVPTSSVIDEELEEDLENAQSIIVDEEDGRVLGGEGDGTKAGQVLGSGGDGSQAGRVLGGGGDDSEAGRVLGGGGDDSEAGRVLGGGDDSEAGRVLGGEGVDPEAGRVLGSGGDDSEAGRVLGSGGDDSEAGRVLGGGEELEMKDVPDSKVAEDDNDVFEEVVDQTIVADKTCVVNTETNAQTIPGDENSEAEVVIDEKPDGHKVDESAATKTADGAVFEDPGEGQGHSNTDSPPKMKGLAAMANDSPSGSFCWSPSASPSTSILKKGLKRQQEVESPSPVNKIRRVSFANPIYQEGLADDIDRRSPVIRNSSSPSSKSLKMLTNNNQKINTTPTKGFVSPGTRVLGFKSSKKSLISEMTKESMPSPKESVYPALMNCSTPVDVILPQITSNMWARGLGQLIRAKNIKTIGDLSTMTPCEIKTLPIRSPKISTVKKALRVYHEQQTKSKGYDEFAALDEAEKPLNGEEKPTPADDEKIETDPPEVSAPAAHLPEASPAPDILSQIHALSLLCTPEELGKYSGSRLFEMQEKLGMMSHCVLRQLQSRWTSPPHDGSL
ncbi:hypothetical protein GDO81_024767, partial [Engystomops pustulosus]